MNNIVTGELKLQRMIRLSKWDKISVVMYKNDAIFTYHKIDSTDDQVYIIPLDDALLYQSVESLNFIVPTRFCLRTSDRDYLFEASSSEEKTKWTELILPHTSKKLQKAYYGV